MGTGDRGRSVMSTIVAVIAAGFLLVLPTAFSFNRSATSVDIDNIFIGRCYEFQQVIRPDLFVNRTKDCHKLLRLFNKAYIYKDPCDVTVEEFDSFVHAAKHDIFTRDRTLYWSGAVTPLVFEYSAEGRRYTTIRDTLAGYILKFLGWWCGQVKHPGYNTESCPPRGSCLQAYDACWDSLSRSFASQVQGSVRVMLNGSNGHAYRNRSTFARYELPNLNYTRNPVLYIDVVHNIEEPEYIRETCHNGTLLYLKKDVEAKNIVFKCTDDPLDVLYLQCVDCVDCSKCQHLRPHP